jgi:hypothetical protein
VQEWRVIVMNGVIIAAAEKLRNNMRNIGCEYGHCRDGAMLFFLAQYTDKEGLIGYDVGKKASGGYFVIEGNRAPEWERLQAAIGIDVATRILELAARNTLQAKR